MTDVVPRVRAGTTVRAESTVKRLDALLIASVVALSGLGLVMVYAGSKDSLTAVGADPALYVKKQIVFMTFGLVAMAVGARLDYRNFLERMPLAYLLAVVSLAGLFLVPAKNGAHGWYQLGLFQLQPAEFTKLIIIGCLAAYGAAQRSELDLRRFLVALSIASVPTLLVFLAPDLGTALVYLSIVLVMLWLGGAQGKHLLGLIGAGVATAWLMIKFEILKPYQVKRLTSFIDASASAQDAAYNVYQSKIAIGAGGVTGQGLFEGTQTRGSWVPARHTDFIFSVVGEQLGFVGAILVVALFGVVCWRIWRAAAVARDPEGMLMCGGVLAMFIFQIFENIGMTMGIMPVTGIPLPFLTYGGSSTITAFFAIGLVLNVAASRFR
jgi:rod shape determining protein RodA